MGWRISIVIEGGRRFGRICYSLHQAGDGAGELLTVGKKFIDTIKLVVNGGAGGMGLPKFEGVGGKGGSVFLEAAKGATLMNVFHRYKLKKIAAESGESSKRHQLYGKAGEDKVVKVPVGVTVYDEYMRPLGELNNEGDKLLVASGGPGGCKNSKPPYAGSQGHRRVITVDLKLIADIGLVGFPNAGKSTLLKAISRANPRIASFAFTTLRPNIGVVEYPDFRQLKMADLPGLVEGSAENFGMGHKFLKHVERCSLLLMVVDINGFQLTPHREYRNCLESIFILNKELERYKSELLDKPAILAVNKMDLPGAVSTFREISPVLENLSSYVNNLPEELRPEKIIDFDFIIPMSAKCDPSSVAELKKLIREFTDKHFEESLKETMTKQEMELLKKIRQQVTEVVAVKC